MNPSFCQLSLRVDDPSQVATARRAASDLAYQIGFDETYTGKAALLATEAATNLIKHAGGGEILLRPLADASDPAAYGGIELLAIDSGPGIASIGQSMTDGMSTAGTSGTGLGAMQRIASTFEIYTLQGNGTVICMRLWQEKKSLTAPSAVDIGVVCLPIPGEIACGDHWQVAASQTSCRAILADGLGHGPAAAAAAQTATAVFLQHPDCSPAQMLGVEHDALRPTRGAAVAVCHLDGDRFTFAGVGNIAASTFQHNMRRQLVSHNGIVGSNVRKIQEFTVPRQAGDTLILHSDGLASQWSFDAYPGLLMADPAIIAAVLYRDFWRRRDDVTVLVIR